MRTESVPEFQLERVVSEYDCKDQVHLNLFKALRNLSGIVS